MKERFNQIFFHFLVYFVQDNNCFIIIKIEVDENIFNY